VAQRRAPRRFEIAAVVTHVLATLRHAGDPTFRLRLYLERRRDGRLVTRIGET
jgi:hypothetical protein